VVSQASAIRAKSLSQVEVVCSCASSSRSGHFSEAHPTQGIGSSPKQARVGSTKAQVRLSNLRAVIEFPCGAILCEASAADLVSKYCASQIHPGCDSMISVHSEETGVITMYSVRPAAGRWNMKLSGLPGCWSESQGRDQAQWRRGTRALARGIAWARVGPAGSGLIR
jgi:hypothetical protein